MRSSRLFFGVLLVVVISTTFLLVRGTGLGPRFLITNDSAQSATVIAAWRDQSRELGPLEPGASISLTVRDEASITFTVRYADGTERVSEPVYFSAGVITRVNLSDTAIDVEQDVGS